MSLTEQQLADYLSGAMQPAGRAAFEKLLLDHPESLRVVLEQQRVQAGLHALCGRDVFQLETAIMASVHGMSNEEAENQVLAKTVGAPTRDHRHKESAMRWILPLAACAVVLLVASVLVGRKGRQGQLADQHDLAQVVELSEASWTENALALNKGDSVGTDRVKLQSGLLELEFKSGARVVVQGPADFALIDSNTMRVSYGSLAAEVPPQASGFTVETNAARFVDRGTRFGIIASASEPMEVQVFEGSVEMIPSAKIQAGSQLLRPGAAWRIDPAKGGIAQIEPDPGRFPQPLAVVSDLVADGDFEVETAGSEPRGPLQPGRWSGDPAAVVSDFDGVKPHYGTGMLRFVDLGSEPQTKYNACTRWQLIDLRTYKSLRGNSPCVAEVEAWFNTVSRHDGGNDIFQVELSPRFYDGKSDALAELMNPNERSGMSMTIQSIRTDSNPATWEPVHLRLEVPPDSDFLLVRINSYGRKDSPASTPGFPGQFMDSVKLKLLIPPRPGQPTGNR